MKWEGEGQEGMGRGISLGKLRARAQSLTIGIMKATYRATCDEKDIKMQAMAGIPEACC